MLTQKAAQGRRTHTVTLAVCPGVHSLLASPTSMCWIPVSDGSVPSPSPPIQITVPSLPILQTPEELALQKFSPLMR